MSDPGARIRPYPESHDLVRIMSLSPADVSTLSQLLDEALDLKPAQAEAWLAALPEAQQHLLP